MDRGIKLNNGTAKALMVLAGIAAIGFLLACASAPQTRVESPGLYWYDAYGWNYNNQDINGEVGHRLYVSGPRRNCVTSAGKNQPWSASYRIISGALPPGLEFESGSSGIEGIPRERGHWIVKLELYNLKCGENDYKGFEQELRFHITGTGKVIE